MKDEVSKEKYRNIFKMLPIGMQQACRTWAKQESWDEETWIETLETLIGAFANYQEAERWIRNEVLEKKA